MTVQSILAKKGRKVVTVRPGTVIDQAVRRMKAEGVGSLVVSDDDRSVLGLVSERDIVLALSRFGDQLPIRCVDEVMVREVPVCAATDTLREVMAKMTRKRLRHIPVLEGTALVGLVSVGDVVKHQLEELEQEVGVLRDLYLART